jgi:hypothetical protein
MIENTVREIGAVFNHGKDQLLLLIVEAKILRLS